MATGKKIRAKQLQNKGVSTVLLIEDEPLLVSLYQKVLSKLKHAKVFTASEEQEALALILKNHPALILLDLMIPTVDRKSDVDFHEPVGLDLLAQVRKNPSLNKSKVIVLSNLDADEHRQRAEKLGADGYLVKAMITPVELLARVELELGR